MRSEYDFSNAQPSPIPKKMQKQITIRLNISTIDYFKEQSAETGVPYQTLINLYLADCVKKKLKPTFE
ncbi:MAG: BrnA antitoxin family protein [Coriobacteriia bacterium]|nr:BrnA antitoxin family protein [Coriobacteriia bacterium]MCL2536677.1 BrnA antitoxin family protein [Coriobacteriia bacterium]